MRRRGGRLLQRVRLQPARAVRLREHVLARRSAADGGLQRDRLRGRGPRRWDGDQLDQLPAHPAVGEGAVGDRARPRGRGRARLRRPPRRDLRQAVGQRPLLGPERPAPAHEGGRGRARLVVGDDHCATPTRAVTTRRRRPTSASATSPARSSARSGPTSRTHSTRAPTSSCAARSTACWSRTAGQPESRARGSIRRPGAPRA